MIPISCEHLHTVIILSQHSLVTALCEQGLRSLKKRSCRYSTHIIVSHIFVAGRQRANVSYGIHHTFQSLVPYESASFDWL